VANFCREHEEVFVIEQNRDGELRSLLINELDLTPQRLISVLHYDGMPITADTIMNQIKKSLSKTAITAK
jgi:2-oxoglutarate ferredoxin oxidoreductase subunit alpha